MKLIFMGSPSFALPTLKTLLNSEHELLSCFSRKAKQKNRGKKLEETVITNFAKQHNIQVFTPRSFKDSDIIELVAKQNPDFLVVVAYGLILPQELLDIPKYAALNLHPSRLPRFRGAAPLHRAIMAGDSETDICIMKMTAGLDEGDVMLKERVLISDVMTTGELHDKAAEIGAKLMLKTIDNFANLVAKPQSEEGVVYADKISKSESEINFNLSGKDILNLIRGLNPYPAAFFMHDNKRYKIFKAEFTADAHGYPAGMVTENFTIYCQDGVIKPQVIQAEGKNKMSLDEFLNGISK